MPATRSITEFVSSFNRTDVSKASRFDVFITPPASLVPGSALLTLRCESAELPGKTFMTYEHKVYGPSQKYPYQHSYNDLTLTFIVSDDMYEKDFFDKWMEIISPIDSYNFRYKKDYAADSVTITQYDQTGDAAYKVALIESYPIAVNQLDLDWSSDGYHKLAVVFAYTRWEVLEGAKVVANIKNEEK